MRIDCESCHAGFQVDESRIPDAGARAVCPRCKHQIVVKRPGAGSLTDFLLDDDLLPPPLPQPGAPVPPDPLAVDSSRSDVFDTGRRTTGGHALPPDPLRDAPTTGQYAVPDAAAAAYASATGRVTGQFPPAKPTPSLFDTLDTELALLPQPAPAPVEVAPVDDEKTLPPDAEPPPQWRLRRAGGALEGPFTTRELVGRHEAGLVGRNDQVSFGDDPFKPLSAYQLTRAFLNEPKERKVVAFASAEQARPSRKPVLAVAAAVLGALAGAYVWTVKPEVLFGPAVAPVDRAAMEIVRQWRQKEPRPIASADELYQLGRGYARSDDKDGPRRATEAFRRAVMRDVGHVQAMSAWAELRALSAIDEDDEDGLREAKELLGYALRHGPDVAAPHVARANLLLHSGSASDLIVAQSEVQKARELAPDDPEVLLAVGRAFLGTNATYAIDALEKANQTPGMEKRSALVMGEAWLRMGRLADARVAFEKRLSFDPDDPPAVLHLAKLDASMGLFDAARRRLEHALAAHPDDARLRLLLAQLAYQIDGDFDAARKHLAHLSELKLDRRSRVSLHLHAAAMAHASGLLDEARTQATLGLKLDADTAALHYRLASVMLDAGQPDDAAQHLTKAAASMSDRAPLAVLQGRIDAARGRFDEAQAAFAHAMLLEPHRADAYLLAASMYAQVGAQAQALSIIQKSLSADPAWGTSHRRLTDFPEISDGLRPAVGAMQSLAAMNDGESLAAGALALAHYHAGDVASAEASARRATEPGRPSVLGRVYLAQILLDRRDAKAALKVLDGVLRDDRRCALAHYLAGRAQAQLGRVEEAHTRFRRALDENPHFLPATVRDAEVLSQLGRSDEARALFDAAYRRDPEDVLVRRGLEALARGQMATSLDGTVAVQAELD